MTKSLSSVSSTVGFRAPRGAVIVGSSHLGSGLDLTTSSKLSSVVWGPSGAGEVPGVVVSAVLYGCADGGVLFTPLYALAPRALMALSCSFVGLTTPVLLAFSWAGHSSQSALCGPLQLVYCSVPVSKYWHFWFRLPQPGHLGSALQGFGLWNAWYCRHCRTLGLVFISLAGFESKTLYLGFTVFWRKMIKSLCVAVSLYLDVVTLAGLTPVALSTSSLTSSSLGTTPPAVYSCLGTLGTTYAIYLSNC